MVVLKRLSDAAKIPADTYGALIASPGSYMYYSEKVIGPIWPVILSLPCGHLVSIARKVHNIMPEGTITPSIVCPYKDCTFHEFGRLEDWVARGTEQ